MTPQHPRDLPPEWFAEWEERASIQWEGNRLPDTEEGHREANRMAFAEVLRRMRDAGRS